MQYQRPQTTNRSCLEIHAPNTIEVLGETLRFLLTGADTQHHFTLIERRAPPHFPGTHAHWHAATTEVMYLLEGMLAIRLGEETMVATPGTSILVPPHSVHTYWNPTASPALYLTLLMPGGQEQLCMELASMIAAATSWPHADMCDVCALAQRFDVFIVGCQPAQPP